MSDTFTISREDFVRRVSFGVDNDPSRQVGASADLSEALDAEHAAFERYAERYAELRADVAEALDDMRAKMITVPPPPKFIITDVGFIATRAEYERLVRRQPRHWALRNPRPLDVTRSLWEPERRGGLSRCRSLARVLGAAGARTP